MHLRPPARPGVLLMLAALTAFAIPARAQSNDDIVVPTVTRTYAIENARVVQAPGRVLDRATIVIRDGLITAVGPDAAIPFDAERIAGDSLVVYAGFIDALSHTGVPRPRPENNRERVPEPGNPPNDRAGVLPERDVRTLLQPEDKSVAELRQAGFTVAHVVPHGPLLPGSGAVILLAGDTPPALVLKGDASLFARFDTNRGVYPSTPMGVIAKLRQLYREAERRRQIETMYAANATGLERPPYDPVHYAFFPVIDGTKPVVFYVEDPLEAHRALALSRELGFDLVLAGLAGSGDALGEIQAAGVPVFFSLALPEAPKDADTPADSTEHAEPMTPDDPFISDFRTRSYEDVEAEKEQLEARQARARRQHYELAARLQEAGIPFAFMTMDLKPSDIHESLTTMIEHGLSEDAALAALTTTPARLLGLAQNLGTIEPGKIANLVVTDGPYFAEDSAIRYVFVDGQPFEMEQRPARSASAAAGDAAANPVGTWDYAISTPDGSYEGTITITGTPGAYSGTITSALGTTVLENVVLNGRSLTFRFDSGQMGLIEADLTIEGNDLSGTMNVSSYGSFPVTGTRTSGPDR
ncbi:hypothetical protein AWN76_001260 [Rhodothermaceae bacterium RA]|nr:hypothetical protein AWN76_001260 [Rhodothermaceae bacterium RA]